MVKFCSYSISSNFSIYLWDVVILYNHHARLLQSNKDDNFYVKTAPCTECHNLKLLPILLQPRLEEPYYKELLISSDITKGWTGWEVLTTCYAHPETVAIL